MDRFNNHEWPAELLSFKELKQRLSGEKYCSSQIKRIRTIGEASNFKYEEYKRSFHFGLETIGVKWFDDYSVYDKYNEEKIIPLKVELEEPVIIELNNGINIELMPVREGILVAENTIQDDIIDGINNNNYDCEKFFSSIVGERITETSYTTKNAKTFTGDFLPRQYDSPMFVIHLENGRALFLINCKSDAFFYFGIINYSGKEYFPDIEMTSYKFMKSIDYGKNYITIVAGHDTSSYFWIEPVNKPKNGDYYYNADCLNKEQISIEEDDVYKYLYDFLKPEFDSRLQIPFRDEQDPCEFEWNLEYNVFTVEQIKNILQKIQNELESLAGEDEEITIKRNFYERFIWRIEIMLNNMDGYEFISFMGP